MLTTIHLPDGEKLAAQVGGSQGKVRVYAIAQIDGLRRRVDSKSK